MMGPDSTNSKRVRRLAQHDRMVQVGRRFIEWFCVPQGTPLWNFLRNRRFRVKQQALELRRKAAS
jgi:hypothetical protein